MQVEKQPMKHKQHHTHTLFNTFSKFLFFTMKKLFVFALAAAAIVGCSKNENGGNDSAVDLSQAQQLKGC